MVMPGQVGSLDQGRGCQGPEVTALPSDLVAGPSVLYQGCEAPG